MKYEELFSAKNLEELVDMLNSNSSKYLGAWETILQVLDVMKEINGIQIVEFDKADDPEVWPEIYTQKGYGNVHVSAMAVKPISPNKDQVMILCSDDRNKEFDVEIWPHQLVQKRLVMKGE